MSAKIDAMSEVEIREGFLCPICMKDLGSINDLQLHFEEFHAGEDKAVIQQLKGLFGKAKRKILGERDDLYFDGAFGGTPSQNPFDPEITSATVNPVSGIDVAIWDPQDFGATRSYTDIFKRHRDARIDRFVVETNKLLIRLDKLVSLDSGVDPGKRKAFEKSVVPWAPDKDVNLCTTCGRNFTLTRRRHHCRLCGGIMCNKCSQFLPYSYARKLTNPSFRYEGEGFHRSSSNSSLNSIASPEGEPHIRTCIECRNLLEKRDQQQEQRNSKPFIVQLYEKMKIYQEEADEKLPEFLKMAESLSLGETTYDLNEAHIARTRVIKLFEAMDSLSKRIAANGLSATDPPGPKTIYLQRAIRSTMGTYLQENMLGLQSLPTEQEIAKAQENKELEVQQRVEAERRERAEREQRRKEEEKKQEAPPSAREKARPDTLQINFRAGKPERDSVSTAGWKPVEVSRTGRDDSDPMIQQMNIIRGYIKQARQAMKMDEVQMLEENLRELQREYLRQQKQNQS